MLEIICKEGDTYIYINGKLIPRVANIDISADFKNKMPTVNIKYTPDKIVLQGYELKEMDIEIPAPPPLPDSIEIIKEHKDTLED